MKSRMRMLSIVCAVCILLAFILPANAAQSTSSQDKANILNKLNILKGDGKDFNLTGQLKRSDAAAFIVKIMGKEAFVTSLQNTRKYKYTGFSDIDSLAWYAPYIGYCKEQNIISGYQDGRFGPDEYVSEKAFLKLALGAVGYVYGKDYTWDNVFGTAYNAGLVTDSSYLNKTIDNKHYTRGNVVDVLYNSLGITKKGTDTTVIKNLLDQGIVTREAAVSTGFIKDEPVSAIVQTSAIGDDRISVTLNENVTKISDADVQVYETNNKSNKLTAFVQSQSDKDLIIKTSKQMPDKDYTVELSNVKDLDGNIVSSVISSFTGFKNPEVVSDYFMVSKVEVVSKSILNVYFTQPVNQNAELQKYYEIFQGSTSFVKGDYSTMVVKALSEYNNCVSIYLKDKTFVEGTQYKIVVGGDLQGIYGIKLNDGSGDSATFRGKGDNNPNFDVNSVTAVDNWTVVVEYTTDIDLSTAQQRNNYRITRSDNVTTPPLECEVSKDDLKGHAVRLKMPQNFLDKTKTYKITVDNVYDIYKQNSITQEVLPFVGYIQERPDLTIYSATTDDAMTVSVYIDRPLKNSNTMATNPSMYTITKVSGGSNLIVKSVYYNDVSNPFMVKLFLQNGNAMTVGSSYKLTIQNTMNDDLDLRSSKDSEFQFTSSGGDIVKPVMYEALAISQNTIKVSLSKEITTTGMNINTANYSLEYKDGTTTKRIKPSSVSAVDATTLIMKFGSLDFSRDYSLKFTSVTDYSEVNISTAADGINSVGITVGS